MIRTLSILAALAALSSCSGRETDEQVEAVSQSEADALDDAAQMIEQGRSPAGPPSTAPTPQEPDGAQELELEP